MTTKILVSRITFIDDKSEEIRGYSECKLDNQTVIWIWESRILIIPIHRIKKIVTIEEE